MAWFKIRILTGEIVLDSLTPKPDAIHNNKSQFVCVFILSELQQK